MRSRDETGWHQRTWAQLTVKRGKKAYLYYFTHVPPGNGARGASHTAELPYMFNNPPANDSWLVGDHKLADMMSSYWVNFIATGDPNGKGLPPWQAYSAKNDSQAMVFGDTVQFGPQIEVAPAGVLRQILRGGDEEAAASPTDPDEQGRRADPVQIEHQVPGGRHVERGRESRRPLDLLPAVGIPRIHHLGERVVVAPDQDQHFRLQALQIRGFHSLPGDWIHRWGEPRSR